MRSVSDRPVHPIALAGTRAVPAASPYAARAYGDASRVGGRHVPTERPPADRRPASAEDAGRALLAARPAAPGIDTEVSIRMYADGGSISVVRHLRGGETVGIEALIR